jgi:hypothetical protein
MSENCGIRVYTECEVGYVTTITGPFYGDRPTFLFSATIGINNTVQNGRIYWDYVNVQWVVENADTGEAASVLPYDRAYPYGTFNEWSTVGSGGNCFTSYGGAFFNTEYVNFGCSPTYFEFCCPKEVESENFIGVQNFEYQGYYNNVFYLESPQFSGCATVIEGPIPINSIIYDSVTTITQYNRCTDCTGSTFSCNNQPIYTTPTPIPVVTANTICGGVSLVNECLPISIPPMNVVCETSNVTTYGGNDGFIELIITGGTPPYNIIWENGNTGYGIYNLIVGQYSYTVTDYYGDYTISSSCSIYQPPIPTPPPPPPNFCLTVNLNNQVFNIQFEPVSPFNPSSPGYIGYNEEGEHIYDLGAFPSSGPPKWSIEGGLLGGDLVNYDLSYPPLSGWTWLGSGFGSAEGLVGDCQNYGDFCMTLNINAFATQPYRIQFQQGGIVNGQPSWVDTTNMYSVIWVTGEYINPPYWGLNGLLHYYPFSVVNTNPALPPFNGWTVQGSPGDVIINEGNCFSEYICALIYTQPLIFGCGEETIELFSGDTINGNPSWYGTLPCGEEGTFSIYWDDENNIWSTDGLVNSPATNSEANRPNNVYVGPFGTYTTGGDFTLSVSEGQCNQPGRALIITTTTNEPITGSDGGIVIGVDGGVEPYEYSVDNGVTYRSLPIFYGLKSGIYVISVKDSNGIITKQSVTLNAPKIKTVYQVSLNTTSKRTSNTTTVTTIEYTTVILITPSLPSGSTITFDLVHTDNYNITPYENSANLTLSSVMLKNGSEVLAESINVVSYSGSNTTLGCQNYINYITATTDTWQNVTMTYGDNVIITTVVSVQRNGKYPCYSTNNIENYSLYNLSIVGCSNCEVSNQQGLPPISPTPSKTPSSTPTITNTALT